jgi:hypothetical protein
MLRSTLLAIVWVWALLAGPATRAAEPTAEPTSLARRAPAELTKRVWAITDAVLDHHLDPPTRQQMILDGLTAVYRAARAEPPPALARAAR